MRRYLHGFGGESAVDKLIKSIRDAPNADRVDLDAGDTLISEGDEAESVYILLHGSLEVSRQLENGRAVIAIIDGPGALVGEMVPLGGGLRTATVIAQESSHLISIQVDDFRSLLASEPELGDGLVEMAIRRAEEGELADILTAHFGIADEGTLVSTCGSVQWCRLGQGETLFQEGGKSDSVYFVVKGRLRATRHDPLQDTVTLGEIGRGDVVGEIGVLGQTVRGATVTAVRDTVVAEMTGDTFLSLIDGQPNMMIDLYLNAVARTQSPRWHSAPSTVVGLVATERVDFESLAQGVLDELKKHGEVTRLSPSMIDSKLGSAGIFNARPGEIEDVRVSRLIHETELASDFLLVEPGLEGGPWSRRALGMIDRVLVAVTPDLDRDEHSALAKLLGSAPAGMHRTVVVVHPTRGRPADTGALKKGLGANDVVHVTGSSPEDLARLARVSVGRANTLVLSGGGGRGFAHIGTYRALVELGFPVDVVGGTSIGAILGSGIAMGLTADEMVTWAEYNFSDVLDYTLPLVSLTKGARIANNAREMFGDSDIEDLWLTYFAMSTDLTTSRPHIHDSGAVALAIRATSAIPGVMPPVPDGDALLIDGGVLNNIPIDVARRRAPRGLIVASDVAPPRGPGAHADYGLSVSGWQALRAKMRPGRSPYPRISAVLMRSMITASMQERDAQVTSGLTDCYLDLDIRGVSMLDFSSAGEVARRGYEAAKPALESWMASLGRRDEDVAIAAKSDPTLADWRPREDSNPQPAD